MKHLCLAALALGAALVPAAAQPQVPTACRSFRPITGTRLDVSATGEVTRVPDVAIISAGVMTRSADARPPRSRRMRRGWSGSGRR